MKHTTFLAAALLGLTACSGSTTTSPSTQPTTTTTAAQTTTTSTTATTTTPPTTTSTTTATTTTTTTIPPATTVPPPTVDLAHPAETDTATWTLILDELYVRAAKMLSDPANTDPTTYVAPGSGAFEQINSSRLGLIDRGRHWEGRQPGKVESVQSVLYMNGDYVTITFTTAPNAGVGKLVDSNGAEVEINLEPFAREQVTRVLVSYDDPTLPWRISQYVE